MEELRNFLHQVRLSAEFQTVAHEAAVLAGYDQKDESTSEMLSQRITIMLGQIMFELSDDRFRGRTHHRRTLYNDHCRGPLCRKAERDRSRERYQRAHIKHSARRVNRRASIFDDHILTYVAQRYDRWTEARKGAA